MAKRLKITSLLVLILLVAGLTLVAGCGEKKPATEAQIADYNKPGEVYVVTTWEADVTVPTLDINWDALTNWAVAEILGGRMGTSDEEIQAGLIIELLRNPQLYVIAAPTDTVTPMEVAGSGNGFIVSSEGHVITNAHLVKDDEDELRALFAESAAYDAIVNELDILEMALDELYPGFAFTEDQRTRLAEAALSIYDDYLTVSDPSSKTQVYTGNIIEKAREQEKGLTAETIKVGDPFDIKEETGKDIAILKINASNLPTVRLGDEASVRDGDKITAQGYLSEKTGESEGAASDIPKEDKPTVVSGTVAGHRTLDEGWTVLQMQIPLKEGSSGSPIFNSDGDVIAVMTFGTVETDTETGATEDVATEKYAIPVSIVKDFMSQSNVSASEGPAMPIYREAVDLFYEEHYSAAKKKFEEVKNTNADFPFIQDFINESQNNINRGLDKGTFPTMLALIIAIVVILIIAVVLIVLLVILPRSKKKGQGPGAGMPGGPGGMPGPGGMQGPPGSMPGPPPGGAPEAPAAPMPGPQTAPPPPPAQTPPASGQTPPGQAPGSPMPGSPEDTGGSR